MALIGKIRNNMWLVFIIIALATASFILMDAMGPGGGGLGGANANTPVGVVAGEKIKQMDFERTYSTLFSNAPNPNASREALWNYLIEDGIIRKEADALGMQIGNEEMDELQFGANMSPVIRSNFTNPNTGQLDIAQLQQIKNQFETSGDINPNLTNFWNEQAKQVKKDQLQTKIGSMVQKAIYTPNWLAETGYNEENAQVDIAVVKIPFDNIPTGDIVVSDGDITEYLTKNKKTFERKEEVRQATYMVFDIYPSASDSAQLLTQIKESIKSFKATVNDSTFALANNGFYSPVFGKVEQLDEFYTDKLPTFEVGGVYGPYQMANSFQAVKLIDKQILPDSVKARHILKRVAAGDATQLSEANRIIDSLHNVLTSNKSKFADLAKTFSDDATNNSQGGDLGYFAQGAMVKPFNNVCFKEGREGNIYKVITQFGIHLVYIEDQLYNDRAPSYQLAYINTPIIPGKETQSDGYDVMLDLISNYPYLSELKVAADSEPRVAIKTTPDLHINDYNTPDLGDGTTTRDIVKWVFNRNTSINDVSQTVYEYTDPVNYFTNKYVIIGLEKISPPGLPKVDEVRSQVEFTILNDKKAKKALTEISGNDLNTVASKFNVVVDTFRNLNLLNNFVAGLGSEPKVLGAGFGLSIGEVSSPIHGNSGIFLVKPLSKIEAGAVSDISSLKRKISGNKKSTLQFSLLEALKEHHQVKDNRAVFY